MKRSYLITIIVVNSILLAVGISLVGISIFAYDNRWPLLTIFVHLLAIFFPTICTTSCAAHEEFDNYFSDQDSGPHPLLHLPWLVFGLLVIVGYAVPVELYRAHQLDQAAVWLTVSGGTVILTAVLIYVRVVYFQKSEEGF